MIGRRAILKAIGISPAAAAVALPALEASAAGIGVGAAGASLGNLAGYGNPAQSTGGPSPIKILNWATWLKKVETELRNQSREVRILDADIASMRLPLNTKIKWQQDRNYERLIANNKTWFDRQLERFGCVEHWS